MGSLEGLKLRKSAGMKTIKLAAEKVMGLEDEPLSPMALMFHKPDSNVYIIAIFGCKCLIDTGHLKANLAEFVLSHPRLYSLQVVDKERGGMKWVQTEVDLNKHVISPEIDPTLVTTLPEKFVEDYLYNLGQTKIDMSKPLWDIHILNSVKTSTDTESVAILRMHHSLGDGMSLMSLMLALARRTSDNTPLPTTKASADDKNLQISKTMVKGKSESFLSRQLKAVRSGWWLVWNTLIDVLVFLATALFLKDTDNPLSAPADVGDTPKRIVHRRVSLDDIKLITKATKTTVNDVVMGVTEAGLSRYLNRRYGERRSSNGDKQLRVSEGRVNNLPTNIRLRAAVFFNGMENMKEKGSLARWGNQIGYVVYPLKAAIRSNPVEYVYSVKANMDRKKASLESRFSYFLIKILVKLFGIKAVNLPRNTSVYFSNMIGPREEVSMFGYPISYIATSCHGVPSGLVIHVITYVDKLMFALAVDEGVIPDPHQLCDDLEESLNIIKQTVVRTN
uniref:Diacylglycerol O-acyltransferase n=1 Tax=Kalanchoe fedtschenkoi TaxID=63787 RepID=A0A7N0UFV7_KALFE